MRLGIHRRRSRDAVASLEATVDALRAVRDGLRARLSLSQAVLRAAGANGSPLAHLVPSLVSGCSLADVLETAAGGVPEPDLAFSLLVLAVQARVGGDPAPAVASLESRARRRAAAVREARALTTQARLSARALMALTPGFLILLTALDPRGMWESVSRAGPRAALAGGFALQALGAAWMTRIVSSPMRRDRDDKPGGLRARLDRVPVVRALLVLARGRRRSREPDDVGYAAELAAMLLEAGLTPARAIELAAPAVPGSFGDALREVERRVRAGSRRGDALGVLASPRTSPESRRFAEALSAGTTLGVPLADTLRAMARDIAESQDAATAEQVRAASLKVLVPLGLLVLPAFVLTCLVPLFLNGLREIAL